MECKWRLARILTAVVVLLLAGPASSRMTGFLCPADMVATGTGTCIDRYPWPNRAGEKPALGLSALPAPLDEDRGEVHDITALCASAGKRACRLEEWRSACRGSEGARYPWGNDAPKAKPNPCNTDKNYRAPDEAKIARRNTKEFARLDQSEPAGSRHCQSASGAHDMIGNVEQWVECPGVGKYGWCLAGRFWSDLRSCDFIIASHAPRWFYYESGGRCCSDPEVGE